MMQKEIRLILAVSFCVLLLTGCSNNKHEASVSSTSREVKDSQKDIETSTKNRSGENSQSKEEVSSSSSAVTEDEIVTTESSNEVSEDTMTSTSDDFNADYPYAVDVTKWGSSLAFHRVGANTFKDILLDVGNSTITLGSSKVYRVEITDIPNQVIEVSGNTKEGSIRNVTVNTQISIKEQLAGNSIAGGVGSMYLFVNSAGGLSLLMPNFAGNVDETHRAMMLEATM